MANLPNVRPRRLRATETLAADRPFKIERNGVEIVPVAARHGDPRQLFWVWAGASFGIIGFITGAVVLSLGLTVWESVLAIAVGDLSFVLIGLGALAGPAAGTTTIMVSRASFGRRGNALPAVLSWLTIVGWEGVGSVVGVLVIAQLLRRMGLPAGTETKALAIVIFVVALAALAVWGHATITTVNRVLAYLLGASMIAVIFFGLGHADWHHPASAGSHLGKWITAVTIVAAGNGLGFMNMPADYSRYLSPTASRRRITLYTSLGAYLPATLLQGAGAVLATKLNMLDPIGSLTSVVPGWFVVPFLIIAAVSMVALNVLNSYSSGLNLLALGLAIPRYMSVIFDIAIILAIVAVAVFVTDLTTTYENFLSLTIWWLAPWTGIFLVDMVRRRVRYKPADLFGDGGAPWYRRGINPNALVTMVVGAGCTALFTNATLFTGPMVSVLNGADISIPVGLVVGAVLYWTLEHRCARRAASLASGADRAGPRTPDIGQKIMQGRDGV